MNVKKIISVIALILLFSISLKAEEKNEMEASSQGEWGYESFPIVEPHSNDYLPYRIKIGKEQLRARLKKGSGTHPWLGVEQLYTDRLYKKKIHVKKKVEVYGKNVVGGWRKAAQGHVLHLRYGATLTAYYATGLTQRERISFEMNIRKLHKFSDFDNPLIRKAYAQDTTTTGAGSAVAEAAQESWVATSAEAVSSATSCVLAQGAERIGDIASNIGDGVSALVDDPLGAWRATRDWVGDTARGAVQGARQAAQGVGRAASSIATSAREGTLWEDIGNASDRAGQAISRLGQVLLESIPMISEVPPWVFAQILCFAGMMAAEEGTLRALLAMTGVGAAVAIPAIARLVDRIRNSIQTALPRIREVISSDDMSRADKIRAVREALFGAGDDVAAASSRVPAGQQRAAERLNMTQDEYQQMLSRNMSEMPNEQRLGLANEALGRTLTPTQADAVRRAHEFGTLRPNGTFSREDLLEKRNILRQAGFSDSEIQGLMDRGITGRNPGDMFTTSYRSESTRPDRRRVREILSGAGLDERDVNLIISRDGDSTIAVGELDQVWLALDRQANRYTREGDEWRADSVRQTADNIMDDIVVQMAAADSVNSGRLDLIANQALSTRRIGEDRTRLMRALNSTPYFQNRVTRGGGFEQVYSPATGSRFNRELFNPNLRFPTPSGQTATNAYAQANRNFLELSNAESILRGSAGIRQVPEWLEGVSLSDINRWQEQYRYLLQELPKQF
jgi:hypothetical protein